MRGWTACERFARQIPRSVRSFSRRSRPAHVSVSHVARNAHGERRAPQRRSRSICLATAFGPMASWRDSVPSAFPPATGGAATVTRSFISATLDPGRYFAVVRADDTHHSSEETGGHNVGSAALAADRADLTVTAASVVGVARYGNVSVSTASGIQGGAQPRAVRVGSQLSRLTPPA